MEFEVTHLWKMQNVREKNLLEKEIREIWQMNQLRKSGKKINR